MSTRAVKGMTNSERIERALERSRTERALASRPQAVSDPVEAPDSRSKIRTRRVPVRADAVHRAGLARADLGGPIGHGLRMLRTMVLQRLRQHGWNSVAIVSPSPNDGKSFVAANLAIAIAAEPDQTALLVDVDLRAPRVHVQFGLEPEVGFEDCLAGRADVPSALLAPEEYPGLVLLPARGRVAQSSELLGGVKARAVFRELKLRYVNRFVVYDLPPVLAGDDALVMAPQADAVLMVVGDNRTRRQDLVQSLDLLRAVPILGTVLNGSVGPSVAAYPA